MLRSLQPNIVTASIDDRASAIATIVAAFVTDPLARFAWATPARYLDGMPRVVAEFAGGSFRSESAYVKDDFSGAALWMPSSVSPNDEVLEKAFRETCTPGRLDDVLATFDGMARFHPDEPHWYLALIGVDPNAQGRGIGAELMRHVLARCDAEGSTAYLEASSPRNVTLYLRHGFEIIGEIQVGEAPPLLPMIRRPIA